MLTTFLLLITYNTQLQNDNNSNNNTNKNNNNDSMVDHVDEFVVYISTEVCKLIGYTLYGTGISMFYWMSVLCLDLFWTLANSVPFNHHQRGSRLRFSCYAFFGCGMPVLQTLTIYLLDNSKLEKFLKPGKIQTESHIFSFVLLNGVPLA